jgi:4-hydroxy-3-polyprenylbenzoate decarboxylase
MSRYTVVITGASGSAYGMRVIEQLALAGHEVSVTMTETGRDVTSYELGFDLPMEEPAKAIRRYLELTDDVRVRYACANDLFDPIASGSHRVDAMVVVPASMGFVASVANGLANNLPERAADVMLKERRQLVIVPRETPLSLIHLRNLTRLAEAGAVIVPAMPAFYQRPQTVDDQVSFVAGKILDVLGVEHALFERWGE